MVSGEVTTLVADWHNASKHAVEALSDALRLEAAPFGVRVILIGPGALVLMKRSLPDALLERPVLRLLRDRRPEPPRNRRHRRPFRLILARR